MNGVTVALVGVLFNLFCLLHFSRKGGFALSRLQITLTLIALLIPILGTVLYLSWYLWKPPPSAPYHLRQHSLNLYGASSFSVGTGDIEQEPKSSQSDSKPQVEKKDELEQTPKSKFWGCASTVFFTLFGIIIIFSSIMTMSKGNLTYRNFLSLEVFAPTSIVIAGLIIYLTLFRKEK